MSDCTEENKMSSREADSNQKFELLLKDNPEIVQYINKQRRRIKELKKELKLLKSKLKTYRKLKTKNASTQTENIQPIIIESGPKSLAEDIKTAAEDAMQQMGFVYEATSGMYYDYKSGYYYNAELGLYYDGNKGEYLKYNSEKKSFDFHSYTNVIPNTNYTSKKKRHKSRTCRKEKKSKHERNKRKKKKSRSQSNDSSFSSSSSLTVSDEDSIESSASDISKKWPPCIRLILKEFPNDKLKLGSLFIITCNGGTIGREGNHMVLLPDINVSKAHAIILYNATANTYELKDLGSQNGTFLNDKRLSPAKLPSLPMEITHGSMIAIGGARLLCHIHPGAATCGHCEPGLVQEQQHQEQQQQERQQQQQESVTIKKMHKKEINRLKKKYGLKKGNNNNDIEELMNSYTDRAKERREAIGSINPYEKTEVASIHESIPSKNLGFKMMEKMGWNQGEALGKNKDGFTEPIPLISNEGTVGLGSSSETLQHAMSSSSSDRKFQMFIKTQNRFQKTRDFVPNTDIFQLSDDNADDVDEKS